MVEGCFHLPVHLSHVHLYYLLRYLYGVGWYGDWKCPLQGFHDSRGSTEGCVQPRPEQHHEPRLHWRRWQSDRCQSVQTGMVLTP